MCVLEIFSHNRDTFVLKNSVILLFISDRIYNLCKVLMLHFYEQREIVTTLHTYIKETE